MKIMTGMFMGGTDLSLFWRAGSRKGRSYAQSHWPHRPGGVCMTVRFGSGAHHTQQFYTSKGKILCTQNLFKRGTFIKNEQIMPVEKGKQSSADGKAGWEGGHEKKLPGLSRPASAQGLPLLSPVLFWPERQKQWPQGL